MEHILISVKRIINLSSNLNKACQRRKDSKDRLVLRRGRLRSSEEKEVLFIRVSVLLSAVSVGSVTVEFPLYSNCIARSRSIPVCLTT